ncbi:hypothetical protein HBB16_17905 [Pseudonocardia sp. MCCB 268]|nr:hypothetical protein [Pseudonocardia cytotoxica]
MTVGGTPRGRSHRCRCGVAATVADLETAVAPLGPMGDVDPAPVSGRPGHRRDRDPEPPESLARCVRAVLASDHPALSVIVVDNDPDDERTELAVVALDSPRVHPCRCGGVRPGATAELAEARTGDPSPSPTTTPRSTPAGRRASPARSPPTRSSRACPGRCWPWLRQPSGPRTSRWPGTRASSAPVLAGGAAGRLRDLPVRARPVRHRRNLAVRATAGPLGQRVRRRPWARARRPTAVRTASSWCGWCWPGTSWATSRAPTCGTTTARTRRRWPLAAGEITPVGLGGFLTKARCRHGAGPRRCGAATKQITRLRHISGARPARAMPCRPPVPAPAGLWLARGGWAYLRYARLLQRNGGAVCRRCCYRAGTAPCRDTSSGPPTPDRDPLGGGPGPCPGPTGTLPGRRSCRPATCGGRRGRG